MLNLRLRPARRWCSAWAFDVVASMHGFLVGPRSEEAQDAFEYVLVIGAVAAALAVGLFGLQYIVQALLGSACQSVDTGVSASVGSCIG